MIKRAYYSNSITSFLVQSNTSIIGELSMNHANRTLVDLQRMAWVRQIDILKEQLRTARGQIYFEFAIPRMGKRVDTILIIGDTAFVLEFKVGDSQYEKYAIEQVIDYTVDLRNFHEGSHNIKLIPVLVATGARSVGNEPDRILEHRNALRSNAESLWQEMRLFIDEEAPDIDVESWEQSAYKPTPTIIEAAQALYKGHNVQEITRSDSGAINLSKTAACINEIVEYSKHSTVKSICFITGVPGAGKTLAGLNIANERMNADQDEHAVFLSGNGPLVKVLREALTRDEVLMSKLNGSTLTKAEAGIKANAFIQNIHHFRDDNLISEKAPVEKVVVFDEAQRAWTREQTSKFMKSKKGIEDFGMSEPEFLIHVMDRHRDWCTIVCLIGGGQEINTGEAGLEEWIVALQERFPEWKVYYSQQIIANNNYLKTPRIQDWLRSHGRMKTDLHLAVSVRSFRSERLSQFVHELLDLKIAQAQEIYTDIKAVYPVVLTRDLSKAKDWLQQQAKGTERTGIITSSGARRLRPYAIEVKNEIAADNWFLNDNEDIRSSYFLEEVATEFDIQGLEIDWACVAWGGNFYHDGHSWNFMNFKGTKWQSIRKDVDREYLKNAYRVLLTRARQGMVIFIPEGNAADKTRLPARYNGTYRYLKEIGIEELD